MYVAYLAAMYQWVFVKSSDINIVLAKVLLSPIPFSTLPFAYGVYRVVVVRMILCLLYIYCSASEMYGAALSPVYAFWCSQKIDQRQNCIRGFSLGCHAKYYEEV